MSKIKTSLFWILSHLCESLQKEEELATIDQRILEVRRSISQNCMKKHLLAKVNYAKKHLIGIFTNKFKCNSGGVQVDGGGTKGVG